MKEENKKEKVTEERARFVVLDEDGDDLKDPFYNTYEDAEEHAKSIIDEGSYDCLIIAKFVTKLERREIKVTRYK